MATQIKCPNCNHVFQMEDAVAEEYKKDLREKMKEHIGKLTEDFQKKQDEFAKKEQVLLQLAQQKEAEYAGKIAEEKLKLQKSLEENLRKR